MNVACVARRGEQWSAGAAVDRGVDVELIRILTKPLAGERGRAVMDVGAKTVALPLGQKQRQVGHYESPLRGSLRVTINATIASANMTPLSTAIFTLAIPEGSG